MEKNNNLYLFTSSYPYGLGESFIENEIDYLSNTFSNIHIITNNLNDNLIRNLPNSVQVIRLRYELNNFEKLISPFNFFDLIFLKELRNILLKFESKHKIGMIKTALFSFYNSKRIARDLNKLDLIDSSSIYYSYWTNDTALALAILKYKYNTNMKCVSRVHGWDVFFEPSKYYYLPFRNFISYNLSGIFSISNEGLNYCKNKWNTNQLEKFKLSRLGVQRQIFKLPLNEKFTVFSCSNIIKIKRVDLILKSLSLLNFNLNWIHFGDGEMLEDIKQQAKNILPKNIYYEFKGRVKNISLLKFYESNVPDLFINLSTSEGVPVSIMEAMSFGIPVIATNVGGTSEIVNNRNGYLLDANPSSKEVANAIEGFYNLKGEVKTSKRKAAYETWNEEYNAENNYAEFIKDMLSL